MPATRREFLAGVAAGLATLALPRLDSLGTASHECVILDLGEQCSLPESLAGYRAVLAHAMPAADVLVVPAALALPLEFIERMLRRGATVILESGAAFGDDTSFSIHREHLRAMHVRVEAPISLWPARSVPYVEYSWPTHAIVRDFSRVVPLRAHEGEIIAAISGLPVGLKRPTGRGTLIVLGSPCGPALWAGDQEARRWLLELVRYATMTDNRWR